MTPQDKGRVITLADDIVRLADRFDALRTSPDVPAFMGLVRDLAGVELDGDVDAATPEGLSRAVEMALTSYAVNGTAPDFDWFIPAARDFALDMAEKAREALESRPEFEDDGDYDGDGGGDCDNGDSGPD